MSRNMYLSCSERISPKKSTPKNLQDEIQKAKKRRIKIAPYKRLRTPALRNAIKHTQSTAHSQSSSFILNTHTRHNDIYMCIIYISAFLVLFFKLNRCRLLSILQRIISGCYKNRLNLLQISPCSFRFTLLFIYIIQYIYLYSIHLLLNIVDAQAQPRKSE